MRFNRRYSTGTSGIGMDTPRDLFENGGPTLKQGPMPPEEVEEMRNYLKRKRSDWQAMSYVSQAWRLILTIDQLRGVQGRAARKRRRLDRNSRQPE